jgi:hypothetical protein
MPFKSISDQQREAFLSTLKAGQYNLLLGAGSSMDSSNGHGFIPSGDAFKNELSKLKDVESKYTLQRIFGLLTPDEIDEHVTARFSGCKPGETAKLIASFLWKRIFTWNIDDALESAYSENKARQKLIPVHYNDEYIESQNKAELLLIHLHGLVTMPSKGYVFSRDQYVNQIVKINPWMTVLSQFMQSEPVIIAGTSLDEVDLDYYLAQRSAITSRGDRGPSILVTADDDSVSKEMCKRHELIHFIGWSADFFKYCAEVLPRPPTPEELVPVEIRNLLPVGLSEAARMSFFADFELVPASSNRTAGSRFLYGHSPTWSDLEANLDIAREIVPSIILDIERRLRDPSEQARLGLILETPGAGKTTLLRRVAFELSKRGVRTLICSALSRIDSSTASIIDLIDEPIVLIVDNFADQVTAIKELLLRMEKKDVVIVGAERSYRSGYLKQVLADTSYRLWSHLPLQRIEVERLVDSYAAHGVVGDHLALKSPDNREMFSKKLAGDTIAIACCRILNDFRPLDRIVEDIVSDAKQHELDRYLCAAIAQHCFMGGVRYEVLIAAINAVGIKDQLEKQNPLPLTFFDAANSFVIPENSVIAELVLNKVAADDKERLLRVFVALAREIRPRVNRQTIRRRTAESRLCGRLFDYDDVTAKFLGEQAERFYAETQGAWQWNSRYWEQVALLNLSLFRRFQHNENGIAALEKAVQHARHAVAIELHPFGLTTLGKVLMTQMLVKKYAMTPIYREAFDKLSKAIELEASWSRSAVQPYATLFSGTIKFLECRGVLSEKQKNKLRALLDAATVRLSREPEVQDLIASLNGHLSVV